jgi:hypothetical protein
MNYDLNKKIDKLHLYETKVKFDAEKRIKIIPKRIVSPSE